MLSEYRLVLTVQKEISMTKWSFPLSLLLFVLFLSVPVFVLAQSFNSTINGSVSDPSGAVVPDVELTLTSVATGAVARARTGPDGLFTFPNLQLGEYELKASAKGFRDYVQRGITVLANQVARVEVKLELGAETQTVEVLENASALNFDNAEVKGAISPETIQELPLLVSGITRSAVAFAKLLPGVSEGGGADGNQFNVRVNGGLTEGDEAVLDGVSVADGALGQSGIALSITGHPWSPEAISEISLLTSNYEPQYGATTSSVITASTKSGTNEIHGSLYEFHRNTVLNARQFGIAKRPKDIENDFGGTIGGPIKIPGLAWTSRRKTYGFFNYEGFRLRGGITAPTISIPSLKERIGDFSDWRDAQGNLIPIYDPATTRRDPVTGGFTRQQFMGCDGRTPNVICPSDPRLQNSLAHQWFQYLPDPTNSNALNNYTLPVPLSGSVNGDTTLWDMRVDHYIGEKDHAIFTWHYYDSKANETESELPRQISSNSFRKPNTNNLVRGSWDHTFSNTLLNNLNLGYNNIHSNVVLVDRDDAGSVPQIPGVVNNDLPPRIGFQDFFGFGANSGFLENRPAFIGNDLLSWVKGKHTLKFGVEYRNQQVNHIDYGNESGTFNFSRLSTGLPNINSGNAIASFILGAVDNAVMSVRTAGGQYARQPYWALYAGDTWKVTPKISFNYGLRWDLASPVTEKHDVLSFFDPKGTNPGAGNRPGRLAFAGTRWGDASFGKSHPESTYYKAFAPRLGIAYSINPKTVVRAGYGVFFTQLYYTNWTGGVVGGLDGFNANPTFSSTDGGITPAFLLHEGFPQNFQRPPFIDSTFRNGSSIGLYRGLEHGRPPYAQQWNLTVERQLSKDTYVTAAYVANKGTRLISGVAAVNALNPSSLSLGSQLYDTFQPGQTSLNGVSIPYAGWVEQMSGCAPSVAQALLPYPQYCNSFSSINENAGNSTYHSFQAKVEKRFSEGFWLLGSYTFSKLISNTDDVQRIDAGAAFAFSPFERQRYKSLSVGDVPNTFSLTFLYQLPFGKGKRFLGNSGVADKIVGGWQVTSIFRAQSGIPYFFRSSQCNVPSQLRAGCVPAILSGASPFAQEQGGNFDPNKPLFNAAAFESPNSFNFYTGAGSRTSNLRGFPYYGHEVALIKSTRISERVEFQIKGEFFNIWNWHTFTTGGTWGTGRAFDEDVASPAFGTWTGNISKPRNIQLGAKFIF
jgi:Carboxypeptidase regulatory-like domain/TonB dependent receptor